MGSAAAAPSLWRCGDGRCVWCTSPNAPGGIARVTNHDVGGRIALPQLGKRLDSTAPPPRLLLRGPSVNGSVRRASARRMCSNMSDLIVTTGHFSVRERSFLVAHSCLWLPTHVHLPLRSCESAFMTDALARALKAPRSCSSPAHARSSQTTLSRIFHAISSVRDGPGGRSAVDHAGRAAQQEREGGGQVYHIHGTHTLLRSHQSLAP